MVTNQDYMRRAAFALIFSVVSHMLHHCQLTFYEQAFRPVPQENLSFVEQASCLLLTMVQDISCIGVIFS